MYMYVYIYIYVQVTNYLLGLFLRMICLDSWHHGGCSADPNGISEPSEFGGVFLGLTTWISIRKNFGVMFCRTPDFKWLKHTHTSWFYNLGLFRGNLKTMKPCQAPCKAKITQPIQIIQQPRKLCIQCWHDHEHLEDLSMNLGWSSTLLGVKKYLKQRSSARTVHDQ